MGNVLKDDKKQQVLALGRLGWSLRRIQRATGVRRETASVYLKAAGIAVQSAAKPATPVITDFDAGKPVLAGSSPRPVQASTAESTSPAGRSKPASEVIASHDEPKPASGVITDFAGFPAVAPSPANREAPLLPSTEAESVPPPTRSPSASACEPYRELIELGLSRGRNAMAIWQDLVSDDGFRSGYQSVRRFVRKLQGTLAPEARAIILTSPGEEAQVDYGTGPMVRDPQTGKYRRTRLFVMTLGYSRKSVRFLLFRSSAHIWAELHEKAFQHLGGAVRVVVLDNLKEGVLAPDIYDPTLNPLYRDLLAHYGAVALPCRIQDPDRKGKVESGVAHAQKTPLQGLRFESLEEAQRYLDRWEARWADTRIHGTTKRQVAAMFAEEKPALRPLPLEPFHYYQYGQRTVHLDGCVEVEAAYYGAPPGWIGRVVHVQWDGLWVRLLDPRTGQLLREHLRQKRGRYRIQKEDYPKQVPLGTAQLLARARRAGSKIGTLCEQIHQQQGEQGVRRILGVLALGKKFGLAALEDACGAALELAVYEYRFVRRYLERRPQAPLTLQQVNPLIRELVHYRDLIQQRLDEPASQGSLFETPAPPSGEPGPGSL